MASLEFSDEENELDSGANLDNRGSDDDRGFRSDEAEEDRKDGDGTTARRIDPATSRKRVIRNPQPKLNAERIQGPKGVQTIEKYFEGFKFQGKGHEKSDLDKVMKRLEHWAHRLFPKYQFDDFLEKMEVLGTKKNVQVYLKKYRLGMETPIVDVVDQDDEAAMETGEQAAPVRAPTDEFDKLIAEQIEKQRRVVDQQAITAATATAPGGNVLGKAKPSEMSEEIKARIEANRKLAIERKNARLRKIEEEEEKKRQSEVSQKDSQIEEMEISEIANSLDFVEKPKEDSPKKVSSPVGESTIEVSSTISDERVYTIPETFEEPVLDGEKSLGERSTDTVSEKLDNTMEVPEERDTVNVHASNGSFDKNYMSQDGLEDIEDFPDDMEYSHMAKSYGSANEKAKEDSEKLLSKEELQREIDNAIEEIISRNAHKNK